MARSFHPGPLDKEIKALHAFTEKVIGASAAPLASGNDDNKRKRTITVDEDAESEEIMSSPLSSGRSMSAQG
jgi:hypothetical protein